MSCKYNNCKHCGYKSECEIFKENAELKKEANYKIDTLCLENAELQDKLKNLASVAEVRLANWQKYEKENVELKERADKAKEIIKTFLGFAEVFGYSPSMDKFITEAEQFLKEV